MKDMAAPRLLELPLPAGWTRVEVPSVLRPPVEAGHVLPAPPTPPLSKADPWMSPAPAYGTHLPGAAMPIHCRRGVLPIDQSRRLHGAITELLGTPHDPRAPEFTLIQADRKVASLGWGLYLRDEARARTLAGTTHAMRIGDYEGEVRFGSLFRFRAPPSPAHGRHRVRLDTITPVVIRNHVGAVERIYYWPTARAIASALVEVGKRIGVDVALKDLAVRIVSQHTELATVPLGKIGSTGGRVRGWTGAVVLDVSALAMWLLECGTRLGLGGRVAFGFGRIAVHEEPVAVDEPAPPRVLLAGVSPAVAKTYGVRRGIAEDVAQLELIAAADRADFVSEHPGGIEVLATDSGGRVAGRWFVSGHAARRFAEHVLGWQGGESDLLPEDLYRRALTAIIRESEAAHEVRATPATDTHPAAVLWRGPKPHRLRYIVAAKPVDGDALCRLMTVLPEYDARPPALQQPIQRPAPTRVDVTDRAVVEYMEALGVPRGEAKRSILFDLRHARKLNPRTMVGPEPVRATYVVSHRSGVTSVVGVGIT